MGYVDCYGLRLGADGQSWLLM